MENKFLLFIIGIIVIGFFCYSTGAGIGSTLLPDDKEIRVLSHNVEANDGGVAIVGDRNDVQTSYEPLPAPAQNELRSRETTVKNAILFLIVISGIVLLFIARLGSKNRYYLEG